MRFVNTKVQGDQLITDALEFAGMLTGNVTVSTSGELFLAGTMTGTLAVGEGGRAHVAGTLHGNAVNNGGELEITGVVNGSVIAHAGNTVIRKGAKIRDRFLDEDEVLTAEAR
jgi:cytoskeletal protein CcmA (bactofilin family)